MSPATAKLAVLMLPKYLSKTGLFASCSHQSVMESPCRSRSMLPCFAVADESFVPRTHPLVGLGEGRGAVQARRLEQHQRLELLEQRLDG